MVEVLNLRFFQITDVNAVAAVIHACEQSSISGQPIFYAVRSGSSSFNPESVSKLSDQLAALVERWDAVVFK